MAIDWEEGQRWDGRTKGEKREEMGTLPLWPKSKLGDFQSPENRDMGLKTHQKSYELS